MNKWTGRSKQWETRPPGPNWLHLGVWHSTGQRDRDVGNSQPDMGNRRDPPARPPARARRATVDPPSGSCPSPPHTPLSPAMVLCRAKRPAAAVVEWLSAGALNALTWTGTQETIGIDDGAELRKIPDTMARHLSSICTHRSTHNVPPWRLRNGIGVICSWVWWTALLCCTSSATARPFWIYGRVKGAVGPCPSIHTACTPSCVCFRNILPVF